MLKIEFRAMGCLIAAFSDVESTLAARALAQVPAWFEQWEQVLSRFRPGSELNTLNAGDGRPFHASQVLYAVLETALAAARQSGGLVQPTLLDAIEQAGYDRSFEEITAENSPRQAVILPAVSPLAWEAIRMNPSSHEIFLPAGLRLDLGGVAKGWAAQEACRRLAAYGPMLVDAGGDIAISSLRAGENPWSVAVADPLQAAPQLEMLALGGCGVATSGIDFRRWRKDGRWNHHLIDPRTMQPAETDLFSVTVIAANVIAAELSAKMVLILGAKAGLEWLAERGDQSAILAYADGRVDTFGEFPRLIEDPFSVVHETRIPSQG